MKQRMFNIPIYDYDVVYLELESAKDGEVLRKEMSAFGCLDEHIDEAVDNLLAGKYNGGDTYRDMRQKKFLVVILPCTCEKERRRIVGHEKRHIEDRILEHCSVQDIEAAAYLSGYLSQFIY